MDKAVALHYAASAFSGAMNAALAMTLSGGNNISDESNRLMTELLSGVDGVESAAVLEGLEELASMLRGTDLASGLSHQILMESQSEAGIRQTRAAAARFQDRSRLHRYAWW